MENNNNELNNIIEGDIKTVEEFLAKLFPGQNPEPTPQELLDADDDDLTLEQFIKKYFDVDAPENLNYHKGD